MLEIVITVPARPLQHHLTPAQPHHGALQPAPLTINNHPPASPSHSSSTTRATTATTVTTATNRKCIGNPGRVSSYYQEMAWSSLLCCTQSKRSRRPVKNYMDCIAVFRTSSRYWEIGRAKNAVFKKKCFLDLVVQEQRIYFDNLYRYNIKMFRLLQSLIRKSEVFGLIFFLPNIQYVRLLYQSVSRNLSFGI